jgi:O-antigen/teichoic acid export membrane protein
LSDLGLRALAKNIGTTMGRQLAATLIGLLSQVLIARFYGPAGNGIIAVALLLPTTLATFLNLGITPANVYFVASSQVSLSKAWYTTVRLGGLICLAGTAIGIAVIQLRPQWFAGVPPLAIWLAMVTFPPSLFAGLIDGLFQAQQDFKLFNKLGLLQPIIQLVLIVLLMSFRLRDPSCVLVATLLSSTAGLVVGFLALRTQLNEVQDSYPHSYKWKSLSYGYKAHLSNILAFVNYKSDIFLVNIFLGPASAGLYVVSVNIAERLWILSQATSLIILPRLSQLSSNPKARAELTQLLSRWVLASTALIALIIAVISPSVVPFIFGIRFQGAVTPLLCLLPGIVIGSVSRVLANDIAARGRPELNMVTSFVVVIANIVGNILLIPAFGLAGAAIATTTAYSLNLVLKLWLHSRFTGISPVCSLIIQPSDVSGLKKMLL